MTGSLGNRQARASAGFCVESRLGVWLAENGGSFHSGLVFGAPKEELGTEPRTSGYGHGDPCRWTDPPGRSPGELFGRGRHRSQELSGSDREALSPASILDEKTHTERNGEVLDCFLGQDRRSLDRTVISLYLILTKLSLKIRSQQSEGPCDQVTPDPSQTVHLLNELFSFHEEYVRLLPETDDLMTPIFWKNAELQKLHTTSLLYSVNQQKQLWTSEYESLIGKILGLSPSLHDFMARHTSCLDYFWASTIVTSRSFPSTLMATSSDIPAHPTCPSHPAIPSFPPVEAVPILLPANRDRFTRRSDCTWRSSFQQLRSKIDCRVNLGYGFALGEEDWKNSRGEGTEETGMVNNPDDFYAIKLTTFSNRFETDDLLHHIRRDGMLPPLLLAQLRISVISSDEEVDQASQCLHEALSLHNSKDF
ncbi:hypothetical protein H4Q26_006810 [Puccinia striiformis f. sp. tritici PST-130]|nr:hypothetical protein H4Q26_006810 [Puccinia striiformis f. sp. tritici PST-130]